MILKTLSPVHIGDGEFYNPLSFLIQNNRLHFLDAEIIKNALRKDQREKLSEGLKEEKIGSLYEFLKKEDRSLVRKMASKAKYSIPLEGQIPRRVFSFIKSGNKPYIPGSEVKGAFRTAFLYKLIKENFYGKLKKELEECKAIRSTKKLKEALRKAEEKAQASVFRPFSDDAKYDILRLLQIGDSELKDPSESLIAAPIILRRLSGHPRRLDYHELLEPDQEFKLDLKMGNEKFKPYFLGDFGFSSQQGNLVGNESSLLRYAHDFYAAVLKEEEEFYSGQEALKSIQNIKLQNTPDSPVLRLGKHEGFLSLTLGLLVKERSPELYRDVLAYAATGGRSSAFPETRKLVKINGKEELLGWVKLIPEK